MTIKEKIEKETDNKINPLDDCVNDEMFCNVISPEYKNKNCTGYVSDEKCINCWNRTITEACVSEEMDIPEEIVAEDYARMLLGDEIYKAYCKVQVYKHIHLGDKEKAEIYLSRLM